jgi:hypothetical protein
MEDPGFFQARLQELRRGVCLARQAADRKRRDPPLKIAGDWMAARFRAERPLCGCIGAERQNAGSSHRLPLALTSMGRAAANKANRTGHGLTR